MRYKAPNVALSAIAGIACLVAIVWATTSSPVRPASASAGERHSTLACPARFTIADLDGDLRPDLATVEVESERVPRSSYSIHVQLSAGLHSAIRLSGPIGGLRLVARDVNGDDAVDLVVSSLLDARVVAVLLNDGHGRFSFGNADGYAFAKDPEHALRQPRYGVPDRLTLAQPRLTFDGLCAEATVAGAAPASGCLRSRQISTPSRFAADSRRGRSPPHSVTLA